MKRFYCTDCKKLKRVRRLPRNAYFHDDVNGWSGRCPWHGARTHGEYLRTHRQFPSARVIITPKADSKKDNNRRSAASFKPSKVRKSSRNENVA